MKRCFSLTNLKIYYFPLKNRVIPDYPHKVLVSTDPGRKPGCCHATLREGPSPTMAHKTTCGGSPISPLSLPSPSPCSSQWPRCSSFNTDSEHTSLPSLLPGKLCPSCLLGSLPCCLQIPPCCSPCQRRPPYLSMKHSTSSLSLFLYDALFFSACNTI